MHKKSLPPQYVYISIVYVVYIYVYIYTSICIYFITVTKIRYRTIDARLYTHKVKTKHRKTVQSSLRAKMHTIIVRKI